MELIKIMESRISVRSFKPEKIDRKTVLDVLEAGRIAPSACNYQPWVFIVIDEPEILKKLYNAYPRDWFALVPQLIIICGDYSASWKRPVDGKEHCDFDISVATDHITLMATEKGLGTCWVCNFNPHTVSKVLNLPENIKPLVILPIGYPEFTNDVKEKKRKKIEETVYFNGFSTDHNLTPDYIG